jgi:hypothetical protein
VSADGQRLLMIKRKNDDSPTQINIVLNWKEELMQRMAAH